jgi:hypothetical protein
MDLKHASHSHRSQVLARLSVEGYALDSPTEMLEKAFAATVCPEWCLKVAEAMKVAWQQAGIKGLQEPQTEAQTGTAAFYRASFAGTSLPIETRMAFEALLKRAYPNDLIFSFPESYSDDAEIATGLWSFEVFFQADSEPDPEVHRWVIFGYPIDFCEIEEVDEGFVKTFEYNFKRFQIQTEQK